MAPLVERRPDAVVDTSSLGLLWIQRLEGMELGVARSRALPEGTPIIDRPGRIVLAGNRWIFLPDVAETPSSDVSRSRSTADAPVLIMPNRLLQSVLNSVQQQGNDAHYRVSGRLTLYRGINAMHLADASPIFHTPEPADALDAPTAPDETAQAAAGTNDATQPRPAEPTLDIPTPDVMLDDNPAVQDLLDRLDRLPGLGDGDAPMQPRPMPSSTNNRLGQFGDSTGRNNIRRDRPQTARNPDTDNDMHNTAHDGFRDGDLMSRRTGRLVRTPMGRWAFAIDQGAGAAVDAAPSEADATLPMQRDRVFTIQPGVALEQLETVALQRGDSVRVELSGRVMTYEDRAYILPTVYRVLPKSDLDPMG
jgi:hypothetical protein